MIKALIIILSGYGIAAIYFGISAVVAIAQRIRYSASVVRKFPAPNVIVPPPRK